MNYLNTLADTTSSPWLLVGDFRAMLHPSEKQGGARNITAVRSHFSDFVFNKGIHELGFKGPPFT